MRGPALTLKIFQLSIQIGFKAHLRTFLQWKRPLKGLTIAAFGIMLYAPERTQPFPAQVRASGHRPNRLLQRPSTL